MVKVKGITSEKFQKKFAYLMIKNGWTVNKLGKATGEHPMYIKKLKKGIKTSIQLPTLINLAKAMKIDILEFKDCIKEIEDLNEGITNKKLTKFLNIVMQKKKISISNIVANSSFNEEFVISLVLGVRYRLSMEELKILKKALGIDWVNFFGCLDILNVDDPKEGVTTKEFTSIFRNLCIKQRMPLSRFIRLSGFDEEFVLKLITGEKYKLNADTLLKIADVLGVEIISFIDCIDMAKNLMN